MGTASPSVAGGGGQPACVTGCLMRALEWGDIDELAEKHAGERLAETVRFAEVLGPLQEYDAGSGINLLGTLAAYIRCNHNISLAARTLHIHRQSLLYRLENYYLLEPERVHVGTMCGELFTRPMPETKYAYFYDIKDCGDDFYFNNVTEYMRKVMTDIEKLEFDPHLKAEILLNSKMVILSSELAKVRMGSPTTQAQRRELLGLMDEIEQEFPVLWDRRNFPKGKEIFLNKLRKHRQALLACPVVTAG